jgi:hypothetical protein
LSSRIVAVVGVCLIAAAGCFPGTPGFTVTVDNRCDSPIRFSADNGSPPAAPDEASSYSTGWTVEPNSQATFSLLDHQGGYVALIDPTPDTVIFDPPRDGSQVWVTASESDCRLSRPKEVPEGASD